MAYKILVINPGSTSTKVAVYMDRAQQWVESISHTQEELAPFADIYSQMDFRADLVKTCCENHGDAVADFDAIVGRGGLLPPIRTGAYEVDEYMLDCLKYRPQLHHASNLGAPIAYAIAQQAGVKAYIYDAVAVDEMEDIYRITGIKGIERYGRGHNLNMRAAVLNLCEQKGIDYKQHNIMSVHLGGGISVGLFAHGTLIDMISDDEGPFSPERSGGLPAFKVVDYCYNKFETQADMMKELQRKGGLISHFGTSDSREVEKMVMDGDQHAKLIYDAMILNIAKNIAKLTVDVNGKIDYIVLTGGIAFSDYVTCGIKERVEFIAPVEIIAGEKEMDSLAFGALRVLTGEETARLLKEEE
ncbi:MAG: butyrate kinase [Emergencia sp.]|nr:butyrate kinase [Emergencia sp.]